MPILLSCLISLFAELIPLIEICRILTRIFYFEGEIIVTNQRLTLDETQISNHDYHYVLSLRIQGFVPSDSGKYECHAKNVVGEGNGTIKLYGEVY